MHHHFHGRGRFGPHGPHGGGRWRGRVFEQGDLRLVILHLIAEKPRHGYEIIKAIEDMLGGAYSPSPGVVYPTLSLLEETGLAFIDESEPGKKRYAASEEGQRQAAANAPALQLAIERATGARGGRVAVMRIRRAMENLRTALKLKAVDGALTDAQVDAIAAAIDAAAAAVERA